MATKTETDTLIASLIYDNVSRQVSATDVQVSVISLADLDDLRLTSAVRTDIQVRIGALLPENYSAAISIADQREAYTYLVDQIAIDVSNRGGDTSNVQDLRDKITAYPNGALPSVLRDLLLSLNNDFFAWGATIPPSATLAEKISAYVDDAAFQSTLDNYKVIADDIDHVSRIFPFYNLQIYGSPLHLAFEVNQRAGEPVRARRHMDKLIEMIDHLNAAAAATVDVDVDYGSDPALGSNWALHGYTNTLSQMNSKQVATVTQYAAWANLGHVHSMQYIQSVCIIADRILRSVYTSASDKSKATTWINFMALQVERYHLSDGDDGRSMNYAAEKAGLELDPTDSDAPYAFRDKILLMATSDAYIHYWYTQWALTLPLVFTVTDVLPAPLNDVAVADFRKWFEYVSGILIGQTSTQYSRTITGGTTYHASGHTLFSDQTVYDLAHYVRNPQVTLAMKSTGVLIDATAIAEVDPLTAGYRKNFELFNDDGSGCVVFYQYADGTTVDNPIPPGEDKPVVGWGVFLLQDASGQIAEWEKFSDAIDAGVSDPCYPAGYDAINQANMGCFVAAAQFGIEKTWAFANWAN